MTSLSAQAVLEPVFKFLQMAYGPETDALKRIAFSAKEELWLFERLSESPLTIKEAIKLPPARKRVLSELLTQYVMFLTMFKHLTFEADFLSGTSETALGSPLLRYMLEHRWPFPQMLPQ
ncbi:hypothetical protein [Pseudomonas pseudonitroreducens]|uniref:hypothetical protein n=1 Tax=Pseudomonas pseudonitroreducens TaxID=2892326 RepID=UPI001F315DFE|nr:hypothetical protein [Pseudomonas pseudonitroreducens]